MREAECQLAEQWDEKLCAHPADAVDRLHVKVLLKLVVLLAL